MSVWEITHHYHLKYNDVFVISFILIRNNMLSTVLLERVCTDFDKTESEVSYQFMAM